MLSGAERARALCGSASAAIGCAFGASQAFSDPCAASFKARFAADAPSLLPASPFLFLLLFPPQVRAVAVDRMGQWLATGSDDGTVRVWEVHTGRCAQTIRLGSPVLCVAWCPKAGAHVVGATCGSSALLLDVSAALRGAKEEGAEDDGARICGPAFVYARARLSVCRFH